MVTDRLRERLNSSDHKSHLEDTVKKEWKAPKQESWDRMNIFLQKPMRVFEMYK
jgi:hypothetical protein